MPAVHSTPRSTPRKPAKPNPNFPLYAHAAGYWAKRIRGRVYYFGRWSDPDGALVKYLDQKDDLYAGRKPRSDSGALTVKDLANAFLNHKQDQVDSRELTPRMWQDYRVAMDMLVAHLGKSRVVADLHPDDFASLRKKLAKKWGPVRLGNVIQRIRSAFKFAFESRLIPAPMVYGPGFKGPSKTVLRRHRAQRGVKMFTREEIHELLGAASVPLRAMILLGINCGFGNEDCGTLPQSALDFDRGWVDFPRPKTGIERRCPLWPETVAAIREALANRPEPKNAEHAGLVFVTKYGYAWAKDIPDSPVAKETAKLLKRLGINGRKGLGFYALRHTFRTIADETERQPAIDLIMGHTRDDMASVYRERISDERLRAVTDHVHAWLFGVT
jgi:integrase